MQEALWTLVALVGFGAVCGLPVWMMVRSARRSFPKMAEAIDDEKALRKAVEADPDLLTRALGDPGVDREKLLRIGLKGVGYAPLRPALLALVATEHEDDDIRSVAIDLIARHEAADDAVRHLGRVVASGHETLWLKQRALGRLEDFGRAHTQPYLLEALRRGVPGSRTEEVSFRRKLLSLLEEVATPDAIEDIEAVWERDLEVADAARKAIATIRARALQDRGGQLQLIDGGTGGRLTTAQEPGHQGALEVTVAEEDG